jgi:hypothetical protein
MTDRGGEVKRPLRVVYDEQPINRFKFVLFCGIMF